MAAGREGVINKDINGSVRWDFAPMQSLEFEAGYSRRGNLYAGDTQNTNTNDLVKERYGKETNRLYRQTYSLTGTAAGITALRRLTGRSTSTPATRARRKASRAAPKGFSIRRRRRSMLMPT